MLSSDNGREFKNQLDGEFMKLLGVKRIFTPYRPQEGFWKILPPAYLVNN